MTKRAPSAICSRNARSGRLPGEFTRVPRLESEDRAGM